MDKRNDDLELDTQLEGDYSTDESFTLEAILSEYKGSAFIAGERKTPPSELDEKVNEILAIAYDNGYYGSWYEEAQALAGIDTAEEVSY